MLTPVQKSFDELTTMELFEIYRVRTAVFVVEQDCAYQEVDLDDLRAQHLFFVNEAGKIIAYARLIPERDGRQIRLGRVLVTIGSRHHGYAEALIEAALEVVRLTYPNAEQVVAQAQAYLKKFYQGFGFKATSDVYLETGIPHVDMVKSLT
ncbi:GNAT family N-acetyltransferase [Levilactobacillus bambusae]|uniref:GNAT family N-acetyltransferase n=1 Tax=Levilactobacillus bambusae TaxID=2024736 RepID=A0A2V1MYV4_9LACO|nr:GNAT family N-acetyltransferase [Levilactobacillus bambusae]PWG00147.1 GNAT family N-acetyltransferase [Levilactobacillus bambusae]